MAVEAQARAPVTQVRPPEVGGEERRGEGGGRRRKGEREEM